MLTSVTLWFLCSQGPRSEALEEINVCMEKNQLWLTKTKRKAFYTAVACEDFRAGAESLLQVSMEGSIFFKKNAGFKLTFRYIMYYIKYSAALNYFKEILWNYKGVYLLFF